MATFVWNDATAQPFASIKDGVKDGQSIMIAEPNHTNVGTVKTYDFKPFLDELTGTLTTREIATVKNDVERGLRTGKEPAESVAAAIWKKVMEKPQEKPFTELEIHDGEFIPEFGADLIKNRVAFGWGPSGCGKSFTVHRLYNQWRKHNKKGQVYVFSRFNADSDEALRIKGAEFISEQDMNQHISQNGSPIMSSDLNTSGGALCIFDDYDAFGDAAYKYCAHSLRDFLENGRKLKICILVTSHQALDKTRPIMRTIWNEAHLVYLNPAEANNRLSKYPLEAYCGLDRKQIDRLLELQSRIVFVKKNFPRAVISRNEIYLL